MLVTTTLAPETTTTTAAEVESDVASELLDQIDELIGVTEELRGLSFVETPSVEIMSSADLRDRVLADLQEELAEQGVEVDEALLKLLGLLDDGADLTALYLDVLGEQVAGFYDGDTKELVVQGDEAELSALSRSIVVHELVHALADQHFGVWDNWQGMLDEDRLDEAAAFQGVIEGEATLVQTMFLTEQLTQAELLAVALEISQTETAAFDAAPFFLQEGLTFPYEEGFTFVQRLLDEGGFGAINQALEVPPTTTEQVIHPGRFLDEEAGLGVVAPSVDTPAGYTLHETSVWGELGFVQLFGEVSGVGLAAQLADGWGGDHYSIWSNGTEVVFALLYQADSARDAGELAEAFATLATDSMGIEEGVADEAAPGTDEESAGVDRTIFVGDDRFASVERSGDFVFFVAANDPDVGRAVARSDSVPG